MSVIERWHNFACKHTWALNLVVAVSAALLTVDLLGLKIDPDWTSLFREDDRVLLAYQARVSASENARTLYLRFAPEHSGARVESRDRLGAVPGVESVGDVPFAEGPGAPVWLRVVLAEELPAGDRCRVFESVEDVAREYDPGVGIAGAEAILRDFGVSVRRDFVRSSLISFVAIAVLLAACFHVSMAIVAGLAYEMAGLIAALALYRHIVGDMNVLAAALPCVLLGLGVDFVIHAVAAAGEGSEAADQAAGLRVYRRIGKPMLWAAVTTIAAFLSLALADLAGLRAVGVLGALGVGCMASVVMLLLPPFMTRQKRRHGIRRVLCVPAPRSKRRRRLSGGFVLALCLALAACIPMLHMESRIERLYDPTMPSLLVQKDLASVLGVYPSPMVLDATTDAPTGLLLALTDHPGPVVVDGNTVRITPTPDGASSVSMTVYARTNPFDPGGFAELQDALTELLAGRADAPPVLTGDAPLTHHLNSLLVRGMTRAFWAVFIVLAVTLSAMFRGPLPVLAVLASLAAASAGVLGALGMLNIPLSAYNLTLFPLFIGIGVDDCFYVAHSIRTGGSARRVAAAVTLTTLTTVAGYGSLLTARNAGFVAMGATAVIGLGLMLCGAVYILPALLTSGTRVPQMGPKAGSTACSSAINSGEDV